MKLKQVVLSVLLAVSPGLSALADGPAPDADPSSQPAINLSPGLQQLVNLASSGATEQTLVSYINTYSQGFNANTDSILYLRDQGISNFIIDAVLNHDKGISTPVPQAQPSAGASTNTYSYTQKAYGTNPYVVTPTPTAPPPSVVTEQPIPPQQPGEVVPSQPAPTYVTDAPEDVTYFYNQLQPYGTWVNLAGYGWCWQPRAVVMNGGWRPYCDGGHWVYSDSGWCWNSDYSWGWAPFHYGRWHQHPGVGWVWFPDRVWGPGWVTWRNDSVHCGWAPLPPHCEFVAGVGYRYNGVRVALDFDFGLGLDAFTFITFGNFAQRDYRRYGIGREECRGFFPHTTIVNNFSYDRDHGVINRGFERSRIEAASHHTFAKYEVREDHNGGGISHPAGGNVIYRQEPIRQENHTVITAQRVDAMHPVIEHQQHPAPVVPMHTPVQIQHENQRQIRQVEPQQQQHQQQQESRPRVPGNNNNSSMNSAPVIPSTPHNQTTVEHPQVVNRNPANITYPKAPVVQTHAPQLPASTPQSGVVYRQPAVTPVIPPHVQSQPSAPVQIPVRQYNPPAQPAFTAPVVPAGNGNGGQSAALHQQISQPEQGPSSSQQSSGNNSQSRSYPNHGNQTGQGKPNQNPH